MTLQSDGLDLDEPVTFEQLRRAFASIVPIFAKNLGNVQQVEICRNYEDGLATAAELTSGDVATTQGEAIAMLERCFDQL